MTNPLAGPRSQDKDGAAIPLPERATGPVEVIFAKSGKKAVWLPGSGTLLDLARAQGLDPMVGCEAGWCGTCASALGTPAKPLSTTPAMRSVAAPELPR